MLESLLVHNSIWAKVWLVKEQDITKEGCPVAQPKFNNLPSANNKIPCPSSNSYLANPSLMGILFIPGQFLSPIVSISLSK